MWWKYLTLAGCIWFMDSVCGQAQFVERTQNLDSYKNPSCEEYLYPEGKVPTECLQFRQGNIVRYLIKSTVSLNNDDPSQQSSQGSPLYERGSNFPTSHSGGHKGINGGNGAGGVYVRKGVNTAGTFGSMDGVQGVPDVQAVQDINGYNYMPGSVNDRGTPVNTPHYAGESAQLLNSQFTKNMYRLIAPQYPQDNIIYSPISLETILALTYTGATGETATELGRALGLPADIQTVNQLFRQLPKTQVNANAKLIMANRLYYSQDLTVNPNFNASAHTNFEAEAESINFARNKAAANKINGWVAAKTQNKIRNLIGPETLDPGTSAILVNAIYFKAKWAKEFSKDDTMMGVFLANGRQRQNVEMMNNEDIFAFAHLEDINAKVLQLPYKDTNQLSMLFILPDKPNGLAEMESNLLNHDLRKLPQRLQSEMVQVQIPKFRIEFEKDMKSTLRKLGINLLFSDQAQLNNIFREQTVGVSKVQHKAYIEVNEAGSEAAAATFNKLTPLSLPTNIKEFRADHPFMFAIVSPQAVYFVGHIVKF